MKIERTFRGSVYLTLTPAMQIRHICIDIPTDPQGFLRFLHNNYDDLDDPKSVPDNYMIRYDFPDASKIPPLRRDDNSAYLHELTAVMTEQQAYPKKIVSLLDVAYCKRNRIGLLTKESEHENLCKTIGYIPQIYRLRKLNSPFPKITGFYSATRIKVLHCRPITSSTRQISFSRRRTRRPFCEYTACFIYPKFPLGRSTVLLK